MAAKLFFIFLFICVPLFQVQIFLLHHFQFPIPTNILPLALRQFSIFVFLVVTVVTLAGLTRNVSQLVLVVGALILVAISGSAWASRGSTLTQWEDTPAFIESLSQLLAFASVGAVVVWQYARRKRWMSVAILMVLIPGAMSITTVFTPANSVDRHYERLDLSSAPFRVSIPPTQIASDSQEAVDTRSEYLQITIPVSLSGLPSGSEVELNGLKVYATAPQDSQWSPGWLSQRDSFWPEDQRKALLYTVARKSYEKVRDQILDLHVELALSEYHLIDSRPFRVPASSFSDPTLGDCRVFSLGAPRDMTLTRCLYPLNSAAFVARFAPENSGCPEDESGRFAPMDKVAYAEWSGSEVRFPSPELSPISDGTLAFREVATTSISPERSEKVQQVRLCPGTGLLLSRPVFVRRFRIQLDLPQTRLQDLAARTRLEFRLRSRPADQ